MTEIKNTPFLKSKNAKWILLALYILVPIVFWLVPADYFDANNDITSGVLHMHHFELDDAVYYSVFSPFIYLVFIVLWILGVKGTLQSLGILSSKKNKETA